jgi:hypothetical protein
VTWIKAHWVAIAIGTALFIVGAIIGASGNSSKSTVRTETQTETVTNTQTVAKTVRVKVKPAGPSGTIPGTGTFLVGVDVKARDVQSFRESRLLLGARPRLEGRCRFHTC